MTLRIVHGVPSYDRGCGVDREVRNDGVPQRAQSFEHANDQGGPSSLECRMSTVATSETDSASRIIRRSVRLPARWRPRVDALRLELGQDPLIRALHGGPPPRTAVLRAAVEYGLPTIRGQDVLSYGWKGQASWCTTVPLSLETLVGLQMLGFSRWLRRRYRRDREHFDVNRHPIAEPLRRAANIGLLRLERGVGG